MKFIIYFVSIASLIAGVKVHCSNGHVHEINKIDDIKLNKIIKLRGNINRIVSLAPNITEIIFSLGVQEKLVGVTQYSDYPTEAKLLPRIGSYVSPDLEKIVALEPDICFATKEGNPIEVINRLESLDIPVYTSDPNTLDSVLSLITDIGLLLGTEAKASSLVDFLGKRINYIKSTSSKAQHSPTIFFQLGISPIVSAGKGTIIDDLINTIRGTNAVKEVKSYPHFTREEVLKLSPDIIVISTVGSKEELSLEEKHKWEAWSNLPASLHNKIFVEEADLFGRPSPRLVDGLEVLAAKAYPELFRDLL